MLKTPLKLAYNANYAAGCWIYLAVTLKLEFFLYLTSAQIPWCKLNQTFPVADSVSCSVPSHCGDDDDIRTGHWGCRVRFSPLLSLKQMKGSTCIILSSLHPLAPPPDVLWSGVMNVSLTSKMYTLVYILFKRPLFWRLYKHNYFVVITYISCCSGPFEVEGLIARSQQAQHIKVKFRGSDLTSHKVNVMSFNRTVLSFWTPRTQSALKGWDDTFRVFCWLNVTWSMTRSLLYVIRLSHSWLPLRCHPSSKGNIPNT